MRFSYIHQAVYTIFCLATQTVTAQVITLPYSASTPANNRPQTVNLSLALPFGALSGSAGITNAGLTSINGDLGTTGVSITGFPPGTLTGTEHVGDNTAIAANSDANDAYAQAKGAPADADMSSSSDLTGMTLYPGVYFFSGAVSLTGSLYLSLNSSSSNTTFIFQIGSALNINAGSSIFLEAGASACDVFWQVGSSATLAVSTAFVGNILAYASINLNTQASVEGGLFATTGSITLQDNAITVPSC
jgi:hypothetical protein